MFGHDHLNVHRHRALHDRIKVIHLKPNQHAVAIWLVRLVSDWDMLVIDVKAVQLEDQPPVHHEPFIFFTAVIAPASKEPLIPKAARFHVGHRQQGLSPHSFNVSICDAYNGMRLRELSPMSRTRNIAHIALLAATLLPAQAPNSIKVDFSCKTEDIDTLGLSCTEEEPCPVFLDLSAVESIGSRLILIGNFHTEANTLYSLLLVSEDAGKTWAEPMQRVRAASLDHIQFADLERGWISGGLNLSLPRDPFLLVTNDGGKTWRDRPIFDEGRIGVISDFWFDNRNVGRLLIDRTRRSENGNRYELYDTQTGGDTWEPKQFSPNPLSVKRPKTTEAASAAIWRLRPDPRSKAVRIEQNSGKTWVTVASFPIHAGECRPTPPPPPTPGQP